MILSGHARLAGVLGWPVGHSRSPRLHGYWLQQHGIDGAYLPLPVAPEHFATAVSGLLHLGFRGANVTVPHKQAALALCDEATPLAQRIGAANTLVFRDGRIRGDNTDGFGFLENLRQGAPGWSAPAGPAVLLGAGGAVRGVAVALLDAGVPQLRLANRTRSRAEALAEDLGVAVRVHDWEDWSALLSGANLLVNCTSLGMAGQPPLEIDLAALPGAAVVNDIVYTPLRTALLDAASARGNPTVDGLGMLLHQARPGFSAWFEVMPRVDEALRRFVLAD